MHRFKQTLGWRDGLGALIFHGQKAEVVDVYSITNIFEVARLYENSKFVEAKLMIGYAIGAFLKHIAAFSEGHYVLTDKGAKRQDVVLNRRKLRPEDVWVRDPSDPRIKQ